MYSEKKKITFPSGLYEYLVRQANNAVDEKFVTIAFPTVEIIFPKYRRRGSIQRAGWLFEELSERLVNISKKYNLDIEQSSHGKDIKIDFKEESNSYKIKINGYHYIPLKSFGNMLSISVWSYIVYITGNKPKEDEESKKLYNKYIDVFKDFKEHWNRIARKRIPLKEEKACYICGKPAYSYNQWIYKSKEGQEVALTPVCKTHKDRIL